MLSSLRGWLFALLLVGACQDDGMPAQENPLPAEQGEPDAAPDLDASVALDAALTPSEAGLDATVLDAAEPDAAQDAADAALGAGEPDASLDAGAQQDASATEVADAGAPRAKACLLPLGDSITAANEEHLGYRYWLWEALKDAPADVDFVGSQHGNDDGDPAFPDPSFDGDHEGWPGLQAREVRDLLPRVSATYAFSHVMIHLGTNGVVYLKDDSAETIAAQIGQIIDILRAKNPDVAILLAQIIAADFFGAEQRVPPFNAALAALAARKDSARSPVVLVDQFTGFDPATDTLEGVHPNERGDKKISARWLEALLPLLQSGRPCR